MRSVADDDALRPSPGEPIDRLAVHEFEGCVGAHALRKQHEVFAVPTRRPCDQSVAAQELDRRSDCLGARQIDALVLGIGNAERGAEVSPRTAGSVYSTSRITVVGISTEIALPS